MILTMLVAAAAPARASVATSRYSVYAAAGSALGLGSVRLGVADWEAGLLNQQTLGVNKISFLNEQAYAAFGFGLALSARSGLAVYGGMGWETPLFWSVRLRLEMNASAATTGQTIGQLQAGLGARF